MRFARLLLAGLLSLGVALQGYASTLAMDADCPMMHAAAGPQAHAAGTGEHGMHHMDGMAEEQPCHTEQPAPKNAGTGHHCACAIGCQPAGTLPMAAATPAMALRPLIQSRLPLVAASFHSHTVFRHWRPPASI